MDTVENTISRLGPYLKEQRLRKGKSLEHLAQESKIILDLLKMLEEDKLHLRPNMSQAYAKAYLQNYLKCLRLPVTTQVTALLEQTYPTLFPITQELHTDAVLLKPKAGESPTVNSAARQINLDLIFNRQVLIGAAGLILIFILGKIIQSISNQKVQKTSLTLQQSVNSITPPTSLLETSKTPLSSISPSLTASSATPTALPSATSTSAVAANLELKFPYVAFKKMPPLSLQLQALDQIPSAQETFPEKDRFSRMESDKQYLFIRAKDKPCWVSYKVDDRKVRSALLQPGEQMKLVGKLVLLNIGNTDSAEIFLNNQKVSYQSDAGVKSLIFPAEQAINHQLPLFVNVESTLYFYEEYQQQMLPKSTDSASTNKPAIPTSNPL